MTLSVTKQLYIALAAFVLAIAFAPALANAQGFDGGDGEKLSPRADLEQIITEQTYTSEEILKAKKAFSGWPAKWYVTDNDQFSLVMPGGETMPEGAPETFLKAKKAFDEIDGDFEFVMPGDNVSDGNPDL